MQAVPVKLTERTCEMLDARGDKSSVARESLERYFVLLTKGRQSLRDKQIDLSVIEAIAEASKNIQWSAHSILCLDTELEDNLYAEEQEGVLKQIKNDLNFLELFALVDTIERYHRGDESALMQIAFY